MMNKLIVFLSIAVLLGIYLFVTAPPPLVIKPLSEANIPLAKALSIINDAHTRVRKLYTSEIVGAGQKRGLKFDEHWRDEEVIAGPLPAQFLREIARYLEQTPVPLGLYLASEFAINQANQLEGHQLAQFRKMANSNTPLFSYVQDIRRYTFMFPDVAVAKPCIDCHNDHKDSPKTDWKSGDVMGATIWSYPNEFVSYTELVQMLNALNQGIAYAYSNMLAEFKQLDKSPQFGTDWPEKKYALPDTKVFIAEVNRLTAAPVLTAMFALQDKNEPFMLAERQ